MMTMWQTSALSLDIDECATDADSCDANADCTNIDGSYDCACQDGWAGNGFSCTGKYHNFLWLPFRNIHFHFHTFYSYDIFLV